MAETTDSEEGFLLKTSAKSQADSVRANLKKSVTRASAFKKQTRVLEQQLSPDEYRGIEKALHEIENQKKVVEDEGMSNVTFFVGSANTVATAVIFCRWPEWLWLFYGIECAFFLPAYWYKNSGQYHYGYATMVEVCWLTSHLFGIYMLFTATGFVPASVHDAVIPVFYSCGMGFMSWFCAILGATLIYHSLEKTASLFVHFTPCLVSFTLKFHLEAVLETMPNLPADVLAPEKFVTYDNAPFANFFFYVDGIFLAGFHWIFAWWVVYSVWLLTIGCNNPAGTFRNMHRNANLGELFENKLGLSSIRSHAMIYLLLILPIYSFSQFWATAVFWGADTGTLSSTGIFLHELMGGSIACAVGGLNFGLFGILGGILLGPVLAVIEVPMHITWIVVIFLSTLWKGAKEYDFIFAKKYTMVLHAMLEESDSP